MLLKNLKGSNFAAIFLVSATILTPQVAVASDRPLSYEIEKSLSRADLIERIMPAVVSISATRTEQRQPQVQQRIPGFPFPLPPGIGNQTPPTPTQSAGSGFFVSNDGYVVTNNHVIQNAQNIYIITNGGERHSASVVGTDERIDIALLKVDSENIEFPFVSFLLFVSLCYL